MAFKSASVGNAHLACRHFTKLQFDNEYIIIQCIEWTRPLSFYSKKT